MIELIRKKIIDKRILILGFGREGESSYKFLRTHFTSLDITISDKNSEIKNKINDSNTKFITGEKYLDNLNDFDIIFKSPGISFNHLTYEVKRNKITSQTDIFLDFFSKQIIGITGTKGKSTTSSLIYHILKLTSDKVVLVGNIGIPPFDIFPEISFDTKVVFELSSHQLEYITKGPYIAILLNLFQEHLDFYKSYKDYQLSKFNITLFQNESDNFIYNADDKLLNIIISDKKLKRNIFECTLSQSQSIGCMVNNDKILFFDGVTTSAIIDLKAERFLKGEHNIRNIMAAVCACKLSGVSDSKIAEGIATFKGLEHRMEYVGEFSSIHFYNDSIATIPEATIEAVKTLKNVGTLILGGFDRGIDYNYFLKFISESEIRNVILIGSAGKRMFEGLKLFDNNNKNIMQVDSLESAVKIAKERTKPYDICLLSPAAASYDMFKNFEERGLVYKKLVRDDI
ncbi:MAG: UDP-N-acetylmuramoyl-L-alanine--D-glutamate ligase [Bacteroidetes bacterium]|nr:UDP-N-acetylmuramoyl-L-alanine--D-glutamate ligase [Bacteroidota bacterium]